jgi:hypothetical protein
MAHGKQCWYANIKEAAIHSPAMAMVMGEAQCTRKALWRAVRKAHPPLIRKTVEVRPPLSPKVRADRKQVAWKGSALTYEELLQLIFIDEKTIQLTPCTAIHVIALRAQRSPSQKIAA